MSTLDGPPPAPDALPFTVLSGCSGGGKSTLLAELARRGFATVAEPGRDIVKEQMELGGDGLPWKNPARFLDLVIRRGVREYDRHRGGERPVFFDRSIVDALLALESLDAELPMSFETAMSEYGYGQTVFMTPPWREIFRRDAERRHGFEDSLGEWERLGPGYERLGYEVVLVPKVPVADRADFVLRELGLAQV